MRRKKNSFSSERRAKRELKKINQRLTAYLEQLRSICYFQAEKLDWNIITEQEYQKINGVWKAKCKEKGYGPEIIAAFEWNAQLMKADLITQVKYKGFADRDFLYNLIKKGADPEKAADKAKKENKIEPIT